MAVVQITASASAGATKEGGNAVYELVKLINTLSADLDALAAKLDSDAGVTDTDYQSLHGGADTLAFRETGAP